MLKKYQAYIFFAGGVILLFLYVISVNHIEKQQLCKRYEQQLEQLTMLLEQKDWDVSEEGTGIEEAAESFVQTYFTISKDITARYREERLKDIMTEEAYISSDAGIYDNTLDYETQVSDIQVYSMITEPGQIEAEVCIFFTEITKWPEINEIPIHRYWQGSLSKDPEGIWKISKWRTCQELLTREEFDRFNDDSDAGEYQADEEEVENGRAEKE